MRVANKKRLNASNGAPLTDFSLANGVISYSEAIDIKKNVGFGNMIVVEDKAGGAGDVDIYAEYSFDGTLWYRPSEANMDGTVTVQGNIRTALQNDTEFITDIGMKLANYVRFAFDPDADSQVTVDFIYQEDM